MAVMIFFTADLHFWHSRIIKHAKRPFKTVEIMNESLIENWNQVVPGNGVVYILGDMFWCGRNKAETIVRSLNGAKILIRGNHDKGAKRWLDMGFEAIIENCSYNIGGLEVNLSHYPYYPKLYTRCKAWCKETIKELCGIRIQHAMKKTLDKRLKDDGRWLLHGHVHNLWKVRGREINVGVDVWGYRPISLDQIMGIIWGDR